MCVNFVTHKKILQSHHTVWIFDACAVSVFLGLGTRLYSVVGYKVSQQYQRSNVSPLLSSEHNLGYKPSLLAKLLGFGV